ncbi:MAG TPA: hypothetical protein VF790_12285 [Dissulfurispiraceae bacterium]
MSGKCISCNFFDNDPVLIETSFPGLISLSSAYASVREDAGICSRHGLFVSSWRGCKDFENTDGRISPG